MISILTIAGSDSGGGAGIQADLKTFEAHGIFGTSAITAVTAQNTRGVQSVWELPASEVIAQIDAVLDDFAISAIKIGMLASHKIVLAVAERMSRLECPIPIVLDPVMVATSGDRLLTAESVETMRRYLIPLATVITPNRAEASVICEARPEIATDQDSIIDLGEVILSLGAGGVLITGGDSSGDMVTDYFGERAGKWEKFEDLRINSTSTHGTGCTLSSAIAARVALGDSLRDAILGARDYVRRAIVEAPQIGHGNGPLRHGVAIS